MMSSFFRSLFRMVPGVLPVGVGTLCLLLWGLPGTTLAQTQVDTSLVRSSDRTLNSFAAMQAEMMGLMKKQRIRLNRLRDRLTGARSELNEIINLLKYPKNVPIYRDTAYKMVSAIRRQADANNTEMKDLYFQWFTYHRELMASFTRYGEMKVLNRSDESLRQFLLLHRETMAEFGKTEEMIQDIYNDCNYLLNSKLN